MSEIFKYLKMAKNGIILFIPILVVSLITAPLIVMQNYTMSLDCAQEQVERISELERMYAGGDYTPCDEASFCGFDIGVAVEGGVKFNEIQYLGTHNSYKTKMVPASLFLTNLIWTTVGIGPEDTYGYSFETLTDQLNCGVRSFELDASYSGSALYCCHMGMVDMSTTCLDLPLAFKEIKLWSDANPGHLPITVLVEGKPNILTGGNVFHVFDLEAANALDEVARSAFGDTLLTPAEILRGYASFGEMRAADDWPTLADTLGKVAVILHPSDAADKYLTQDPTMRTQALCPCSKKALDTVGFVMVNSPLEKDKIKSLVADGFFVRTRIDLYKSYTDLKRESGIESGAQILSTDYPPRIVPNEGEYVATIDGKTAALRG